MNGEVDLRYVPLKNVSQFITEIIGLKSYEKIFERTEKFVNEFVEHEAFIGAIIDDGKIKFEYTVNTKKGMIYEKHELPLDERESLTGWVAVNRKALLINDTFDREQVPSNLKLVDEPMRSWIGVPILYGDTLVGVISIQRKEAGGFSEIDVYLLQALANLIAPVLFSLKLQEEIKGLKQKEFLLEQVLSPVIIIQDEKVVYANLQMEKFLGIRKDELIGKNFLLFIHPDERGRILENYRKRVQGVYVSPEYEVKFLDSRGEEKWGLIRARRILWNGRWADAVSIADITELKKYSESLTLIEKYIRNLRRVNDEGKLYDIVISALHDIVDVDKVAIGRIYGDDLEVVREFRCNERGLIENREIIKSAIMQRKGKVIKIGDENAYFTPILVGEEIYGFLCVIKDVKFEQKERALIDIIASHLAISLHALNLRRRIEESRNVQKLMVQIIGHDLRNIFAVIKGFAELLREEYSEEYISEIFKAIDRGETLIAHAKLFSMLDIYQLKEKLEDLKLREIVEDASREIASKFKDADIVVSGDANIKGYILLKNVFMNLFDNALKYGASKVKVMIKKMDNRVRIEVRDNGHGIPEHMRDAVFEEFRTVDKDRHGWGLGLWIVKKIIELHRGKIWIEENKPRGSVFVIELPLRPHG